MNNEPKDQTGVIILDRGMNKDECRAMCTSPQIPLWEKLFKMIYETRPREVLEARIELWNRNTSEMLRCGQQEEGAYFHYREDWEEADAAAFREDD